MTDPHTLSSSGEGDAPSIGLLFAGQGAQYVGMGHGPLARDEDAPILRDTLQEADDALGFALSRILAEGPAEKLNETAFTQPAILTVAIAQWRLLGARGLGRGIHSAAGHSLGEYGALVVAGALPFADALRLVHLRGRAMQESVPIGEGAMCALIGLDPARVSALCAEASQGEVLEVAGINCPGQITASGAAAAVDRLLTLAEQIGARNCVKLPVSAPFHCALLEPAARRLGEALAEVDLQVPAFPIYQNVDGAPSRDPQEIRHKLVQQVTRPVLWERCLREMMSAGARSFLELGPGRSVAGMLKRIDRGVSVVSLDRSDCWALLER